MRGLLIKLHAPLLLCRKDANWFKLTSCVFRYILRMVRVKNFLAVNLGQSRDSKVRQNIMPNDRSVAFFIMGWSETRGPGPLSHQAGRHRTRSRQIAGDVHLIESERQRIVDNRFQGRGRTAVHGPARRADEQGAGYAGQIGAVNGKDERAGCIGNHRRIDRCDFLQAADIIEEEKLDATPGDWTFYSIAGNGGSRCIDGSK